MAAYLLDTNHMSAMIRPTSTLRDEVRQKHRKGHRFGTPWPVLCELEAGIVHHKNDGSLRRALQVVLRETRIWPIDWDVVHLYGDLFHILRKKGRLLSHVDLVLACLAKNKKLTLLTTDKDFEAVSGLKTENWVG